MAPMLSTVRLLAGDAMAVPQHVVRGRIHGHGRSCSFRFRSASALPSARQGRLPTELLSLLRNFHNFLYLKLIMHVMMLRKVMELQQRLC